MTPTRATPHLSAHAMVAQQTHIHVKCLHECHMSCMKCHHAHIPSHLPNPSHMHMPSVKPSLVLPMTHVSSPYRLTSTQCKCQWATNPKSISFPITQPEVYAINMTVCLLWATKLFRLTPRVSYTHTELFRSHCRSLIPMFQAFQLRGLTVSFLLRPTHLIYISFYVLNCETFIRRHPKYELTTHSSTMMMDDPIHAHTRNIMRCPCAYAMLMPLHVLMLHV